MKRAWWVVAMVGWASVLSCGDGNDADSPSAPVDMSPQAVCDFYAARDCAAWAKCSPYVFRNFRNDAALCRERAAISCVLRLAATGTNQTPQAMVDCARVVEGMTCEQYGDYDRWPAACATPAGKLSDGAGCVVNGQCSGGFCAPKTPACGVCQTVSRLGEACSTSMGCLNLMPCVDGVCAPHPHQGEPCDAMERYCVEGFYCRGIDATTGLGTCEPGLPEGSLCDPFGDECDYYQKELVCDEFTRTCKKAAPVKKVGEMCDDFQNYCTPTAECLDGVCRELPREGKPCGGLNSAQCLSPARCINGVCRLRDAAVCQ